MFEISSTSASCARSCWQKFNFQYVHGLKRKTKPIAMTTGSAVHDGFESFYLGKDKLEILKDMAKTFDEKIQASDDAGEVENLVVAKYTALGMFSFYPTDLSTFESIEPEKSFDVSLARGIRLVGRVDGAVKQKGLNWIREVKTTGMGLKQFQGRAQVSYQVSSYIYALEKSSKSHYEGVMYDAIRKPALRKRVNESAEEFGKRIYEDYAETQRDEKKRQSYYERIYIYRSKQEMKCFAEDMTKLAREMRKRSKSRDFFRNPDACWMFNSACEFMPICWQERLDPELIQSLYEKRKTKFQPTEEESDGEA